jgi:putative copper resistance protein D
MDMLAVAVRFGTYAALSLIAGLPLFFWLSLGAVQGGALFRRWRGPYVVLLILGAGISLLGLLCATAAMAGAPVFPVDWDMVRLVLSATASGKAMLARAALLLAMLPLLWLIALRPMALLAAVAAVTLAWSGHAAAGEGALGWIHLAADMVHILAAALWIGGMACLLASLRQPRSGLTLSMLGAFALIGSIIVALLIATGVLNTAMILGLDGFLAASGTTYGQLLAVKVTAFLLMLALAANNRFRLTPAFERDPVAARPALRRAIGIEIGLASLILILVAWLGMIDPAGPA